MNKLGNGENGEFTFLDMLTIMSFLIGLQNLDANITQNDMQKSTEKLDKTLKQNVSDIHRHLKEQDKKIDYIMGVLSNAQN